MKRRINLDQTSAWVIAIVGALAVFSGFYLLSSKIAHNYQDKMKETSMVDNQANLQELVPAMEKEVPADDASNHKAGEQEHSTSEH